MKQIISKKNCNNLSATIQLVPKNNDLPKVQKNPISVPLKFRPYELNQIINYFFRKKNIYSFSINGELLRTSLEKFIERRSLSLEKKILVNYFYTNSKPEQSVENNHQDWVSAVCLFKSFAATCSYDTSVSIWQGKNLLTNVKKHKNVPKAMALIDEARTSQRFVTGGKDRSIILWKYNHTKSRLKCIKKWLDSKAICSLTCSHDLPFIISGNWNGELSLHSTEINFGQTVKFNKENQINKISIKKNCPINAISWPSKISVFAGSWSGLFLLDPNKNTIIHSWSRTAPINDLNYSFEHNLLITAHSDRNIRFFDSRTKSKNVLKMYKSHHKSVSSVRFGSMHQFASSGYDGILKLWDIRSMIPLCNIEAHKNSKIFCLTWKGKRLATGGSDNKLKQFIMK